MKVKELMALLESEDQEAEIILVSHDDDYEIEHFRTTKSVENTELYLNTYVWNLGEMKKFQNRKPFGPMASSFEKKKCLIIR